MTGDIIIRTITNRGCLPHLEKEGKFTKPIPIERTQLGFQWHKGLTPFQRLNSHQTLASSRRYVHFHPFPNTIPQDELDFILSSQYNHSSETFAERIDTVLQPETVNKATWKRLRNTVDIYEKHSSFKGPNLIEVKIGNATLVTHKLPHRYNNTHPVLVGGIMKRSHPSSVKLLISSHHSPMSNAGYSRQPSDGNTYQY